MNKNRIIALLFFLLGWFSILEAQNLNLLTPGNGVTFDASSAYPVPPSRGRPANIAREVYQMRWESNNEKEGAWIRVKWEKVQTIKELWIMTKSKPYDIALEPDQKDGKYSLPRKVKISFADGTSIEADLRIADYFQVITLPEPIRTNLLQLTIEQIWEDSGAENTGLCKVKAFAESHQTDFDIKTFEMYDVKNDLPVQSAEVEIVNAGHSVCGAQLIIRQNGKISGIVDLDEIPAHSVTKQQIWIPTPFNERKISCQIKSKGNCFPETRTFTQKPYHKNYFDGGEIDIIASCHNDLGWLDTQAITADYRADVLIAPALDLMKTDPEFKYTMESVEYLKEFLIRHPERKDELIQRVREQRFVFGASYIQNLQVQVGQEKLVRQFYYGKRWMKETFPGCDTRFYINTDVPGMTYQLPQILKKSGIDFIIQGRFPWGFYYWQGLDGTTIPMFAFRYGSDSRLMNPTNNTGYLKFLNEREYYYKPRQLPKSMLYDFNSDYLPPCPALIPFAKNQNISMEKFANKWNSHFNNEPEKQITPPKILFVEPNEALKKFFGHGELNIETLKGDWPMSWAYYDEPGHRDGLLMGRKGHNALLKAEGLFANLNVIDSQITYPQHQFDEGWLANCWPDHGWGGNRGIIGDQVCVDSYSRSLNIGESLVDTAQKLLLNLVPRGTSTQIPVVVYNSSSWTRSDLVTCKISYPANWKGLKLKDSNGNEVTCERISHSPDKQEIELALLVTDVPSIGYKTYYACEANDYPQGYNETKGDSIENDCIKVKFGAGGITELFDKMKKLEVLKTDKFFGGEVIQLEAPTVAWENQEPVTMNDFDKTSLHEFKTIRAVESPLRYIIEKEAQMKYFTLRERFILNKHSRELIVEADVLNWTGEKARELRIVFPVNMDKSFDATYDVPFGRVEMNRDNVDYSYLPDNYECQFVADRYGRKDLPFREAINWVDVSTGNYKGNGCLFASDMTVHLFRDETADPVDYPVVQHVLLATRESFGWNPKYSFTQQGSHSYRMALYPHDGNWRFAYQAGMAFNNPLTAFCGKAEAGFQAATRTEPALLPVSKSFLSVEPANIMVSTMKKAEDGRGTVIRFYEAEGRYTKAKITGVKPFTRAFLTDMLEYNIHELPVNVDGSVEISVKPYEIITLRTYTE
ncbi:MAG: glycosyl hydrolase-related protein [Bacteroidales bacterium]|nr:glycosyl hydrolase-related protein [Bacteroidales bacterium]